MGGGRIATGGVKTDSAGRLDAQKADGDKVEPDVKGAAFLSFGGLNGNSDSSCRVPRPQNLLETNAWKVVVSVASKERWVLQFMHLV